MEKKDFQKILDILIKAIPGSWKKLVFLAKYLVNKNSMEFFTKYQDKFVSCFEDKGLKVTEEELKEIFKKIDDILREEQRKNIKDNKTFTSFTMIVDSQGEMKAEMDYIDFHSNEPEYDKKWRATFLTEAYQGYFSEAALEWYFVKPLKDEGLLAQFEGQYGKNLPQDFKDLFKVANGGSPSKAIFDTEEVKRLQLINLLSFNKEVEDTEKEEQIYPVIDSLRNDPETSELIPFASTGFDNFLCLDSENKVILYQSKSKQKLDIANSVTEFIALLHQ